jgi:hypothetical protein
MLKPPYFVINVEEGRVYADQAYTTVAIIDNNNKVIGDVSYQYRNNRSVNRVKENGVFKTSYFKAPYAKLILGLIFVSLKISWKNCL